MICVFIFLGRVSRLLGKIFFERSALVGFCRYGIGFMAATSCQPPYLSGISHCLDWGTKETAALIYEKSRADNSSLKSACYRLCVCASGSITTSIFSSFSLMIVSCLHFGQYRGKFFSSVSFRTRVRVLFPHTGHLTQYSFFTLSIRHSPYHISCTSQVTKLTISSIARENTMIKARYSNIN